MKSYLPNKHMIIAGLLVTALGFIIYNKSATVRKVLGAAA